MKKITIVMTLMMCLVMSFSFGQDKNLKSYDSSKIEAVFSYGDNEIWNLGFRVTNFDNLVFDIGVGSTFNGFGAESRYLYGQTKKSILVAKIGVGKLITKDLLVGVNYQYTDLSSKTKNFYWPMFVTNSEIKSNFGLFLTYYIGNVGINFTNNSVTGNSIGVALKISGN